MKMAKDKLELSPLRSLDDFLLGSARFQLPNFRDLEKWGNRMVQNLLYYQTNYFLLTMLMILLVTLLHPLKMLSGALSVFVMYGLFYYFAKIIDSGTKYKNTYKVLGVVLSLSSAGFIISVLGSLFVFLFGILLPISTVFVHASLRLRNLKNKLSNIERIVSQKTPMGVFLESLGMETEFLS